MIITLAGKKIHLLYQMQQSIWEKNSWEERELKKLFKKNTYPCHIPDIVRESSLFISLKKSHNNEYILL